MADKILNSFDVWIGAQGWKSKLRLKSVDNISLEGIARLRELILELAVRGRLEPQEPSAEPASALLKKISTEREQLVKQGKIKTQKSLTDVSNDEKLYKIPLGWEYCRLGTLVNSITSGGTPSKSNPEYWNGDIPWASVKDLGKSKYLEATQDYITQAGLDNGSKLADKDDIIICTRMGLGKIAIAKTKVAINQDLKAVRLTSFLNVDFFLIFFATINIEGTGTTVEGIRQEELLNYVVTLPPLKEQHRIVAKVDELMALCDELEQQETNHLKSHQLLVETLLGTLTQAKDAAEFQTAWATLAQHFDDLFITEDSIDQLKQTILQLAVMGKLVKQDPKDEPASVLLERIREESPKEQAEKGKTLPQITSDDLPFILPESWKWVRLGNIINVKSSKRIFVSDYVDDGVPFYRSKEIGQLGRGENVTTQLFISNLKYEKLKKNFGVPKEGDILIACIGGSIGNTWLVDSSKFYYKDGNLVQLDSIPQVSSVYLLNYLNSRFFYQTSLGIVSGSAYDALTIEKIKKSLFPLPPFLEQQRIVARIDELFALCDSLKDRITESQKVANLMADSILEQVG